MYKLSSNTLFNYDVENDSSYLFDFDSGEIFQLNMTSAEILKLIEEGFSMEDLSERLYIAFEKQVEKSIILADVQMFIRDLIEKGYIYNDETAK